MDSKLARIFQTFTFRLGLIYVVLFSLSVILLFGFIYTFAMNYLEGQVNEAIRLKYQYLAEEYRQTGSSGLEARIKDAIADDTEGTQIYLLINQKQEKIAGNLNTWPTGAIKDGPFDKDGFWVHFRIEGTSIYPKGIRVKAVMVPLSKWRSLLVGLSLQESERIQQTIVQTFGATLLLTLLIAFIGALVMTRSVMRRINVINRSAVTIMHGNLSARIPFTSGGDEFDELSSNLNQMLDKIEMLLQSLSQFANNIAHDLRSPLNRIITRLDANVRNMEDPKIRKLLQQNIADMEGLVATFNAILKISELEANTEFRTFEPCELRGLVENLIELYEPYAAEKNITLSQSLPTPLIIHGEKHLLTQAFANLIDNAIKFTESGGRVHIGCDMSEGSTTLTFADNGPGIPPEYRDKVFEKFFRMEQSRHTKGNGLGLSLVAAIARIHGAHLSLRENMPGLIVCFSFPQVANA